MTLVYDVSETAAGAPRRADGSLPRGFAQLKQGSIFIDKGKDLGGPYSGSAPDIGPFELGYITKSIGFYNKGIHSSKTVLEVNNIGSGLINLKIVLSAYTQISLKLYNSIGLVVTNLLNEEIPPGCYSLKYDFSNLCSGTYYVILRDKEGVQSEKISIYR